MQPIPFWMIPTLRRMQRQRNRAIKKFLKTQFWPYFAWCVFVLLCGLARFYLDSLER